MAKIRTLQLYRGTTAQNNAYTGSAGELTMDTTTNELRLHDGSTVGGHTIPTKNYSYSKTESDNLLSIKANVVLDNITSIGKETVVGWGIPDLTTGVSVSTSGFTSTKKQWLCIRAGATNNYLNVLVNGVIISTRYSTANTNTTNWYPLDVGDVVTFAGTSSYFDCATYDMKGL